MVQGHGINDMERGWAKENKWNYKVYRTWSHMLERCYSEKYHKKQPSYIDCLVSNRWLLLSNFVEDFPKIDGYDRENFLDGKLELDKDIKSDGKNKEYSLENCMLVSKIDNIKHSNKYMTISNEAKEKISKKAKERLKNKENIPMYGKHHSEESKRKNMENHICYKVMQFNLDGTSARVEPYNSISEASRITGISKANIHRCCEYYLLGEKEYLKKYKYATRKAGGFIWKYYNEDYKK